MVRNHQRPAARLFSMDDLRRDRWRAKLLAHLAPSLLSTAWWVTEFLAKPHPDLGRDGPVCPFIKPAIERGTLWLAVEETSGTDVAPLLDLLVDYRDRFLELPPLDERERVYKAIVVVFPSLNHREGYAVVDAVQAELKSKFVVEGLMVGQFHPACMEPGVRSELFRPLAAPLPMLAVRHMTEWDLPFLTAPGHLREYDRRFAGQVPDRLKPLYEKAKSAECVSI